MGKKSNLMFNCPVNPEMGYLESLLSIKISTKHKYSLSF